MHLWIDSKFVADGLLFRRLGWRGVGPTLTCGTELSTYCNRLGRLSWSRIGYLAIWTRSSSLVFWRLGIWTNRWGRGALYARPRAFLQLRADAKRHYELCADRLRQLQTFYFAIASKTSHAESENTEGIDVSLFGFVDEPQMSVGDLYIPSLEGLLQALDSRLSDLPMAFVSSLINHLIDHSANDSGIYIRCVLKSWLFGWSRTFHYHSPSIILFQGRRNSIPSLPVLKGQLSPICWGVWRGWLFGFWIWLMILSRCCFVTGAKLTLRFIVLLKGLFLESGGTVSRCQTLLRCFTASHPIRRVCDLARPAWGRTKANATLLSQRPLDRKSVRAICVIHICMIFLWLFMAISTNKHMQHNLHFGALIGICTEISSWIGTPLRPLGSFPINISITCVSNPPMVLHQNIT